MPTLNPQYTQESRVLAIEHIMLTISRMRSVGGYTAIQTVRDFINTLIENPKLAARLTPPYLDKWMIEKLIELKISKEDLHIVENNRIRNRELITELFIKMVERGKSENLSSSIASRDLKEALMYQSSAKYLTIDEIKQIKKSNILEIDSEWVMQKINLQGWSILIDNYKISPREAINFFEPLSLSEKENLAALLKTHYDILLLDLSALLQHKISYADALKDLKLVASGGSTAYPGIRDTKLVADAHLDNRFIDILPMEELRLSIAKTQALEALAKHNLPTTQSLATLFNIFQECQLSNICPNYEPALDGLAKTPKNMLEIAHETTQAMDQFSKTAVNQLTEQRKLLTQAFETWVACYAVTQSAPIAREICQTLWNTTLEMIASSTSVAADKQLSSTDMPVFTDSDPTAPAPLSIRASQDSASSANLIVGSILLAGSLVTTGYCLWNRLGKKPKADKGYQPLSVTIGDENDSSKQNKNR